MDVNNMSEKELIVLLLKKSIAQEKKIDELTDAVNKLVKYVGDLNQPLNKAVNALDPDGDESIVRMLYRIDGKFGESNYRLNESASNSQELKNSIRELDTYFGLLRNRYDEINSKLDKLHEKIDK